MASRTTLALSEAETLLIPSELNTRPHGASLREIREQVLGKLATVRVTLLRLASDRVEPKFRQAKRIAQEMGTVGFGREELPPAIVSPRRPDFRTVGFSVDCTEATTADAGVSTDCAHQNLFWGVFTLVVLPLVSQMVRLTH